MAAAAPGARVNDIGDEFVRARLEFELAAGRCGNSDFKGLTVKQERKRIGSDLGGVDHHWFAIQRYTPAGRIAYEIDDAGLFSGGGGELDFVSHGVRSSCSRRPCCFQREGWSAEAEDG